jgi:hypothetical protein
MSSYNKATDFASKDALSSGDPLKIIRGTELDDEYSALETAVNSKSDTASPTFTGTATFAGVTVNGTLTLTSATLVGLQVDTIAEKTATNGVTIDSLLIKDGGVTAAGTSTFAGQTISDLGTVTTANIDGGTVDGAVIGGASAAAGTFTTLTASTSLRSRP